MKHLISMLCLATFFAACDKETAEEEHNENELITTVLLSIKEKDAANAVEYAWRDIDGAGGQEPQIDTIVLAANKEYTVQLGVLDESQGTPVAITSEISEEGDAHRFYFAASSGLGIEFSGFDRDENNVSLGLNAEWRTRLSSTGDVTITLRHYPAGDKQETDPVNSTKSTTDAEVVFPVKVIAP